METDVDWFLAAARSSCEESDVIKEHRFVGYGCLRLILLLLSWAQEAVRRAFHKIYSPLGRGSNHFYASFIEHPLRHTNVHRLYKLLLGFCEEVIFLRNHLFGGRHYLVCYLPALREESFFLPHRPMHPVPQTKRQVQTAVAVTVELLFCFSSPNNRQRSGWLSFFPTTFTFHEFCAILALLP